MRNRNNDKEEKHNLRIRESSVITMPDLNEKHFSGESDITTEKARELTTKGNIEAVNENLTKLGWEGQPIATVNLRISTDGRRVEDGQFNLRVLPYPLLFSPRSLSPLPLYCIPLPLSSSIFSLLSLFSLPPLLLSSTLSCSPYIFC